MITIDYMIICLLSGSIDLVTILNFRTTQAEVLLNSEAEASGEKSFFEVRVFYMQKQLMHLSLQKPPPS